MAPCLTSQGLGFSPEVSHPNAKKRQLWSLGTLSKQNRGGKFSKLAWLLRRTNGLALISLLGDGDKGPGQIVGSQTTGPYSSFWKYDAGCCYSYGGTFCPLSLCHRFPSLSQLVPTTWFTDRLEDMVCARVGMIGSWLPSTPQAIMRKPRVVEPF